MKTKIKWIFFIMVMFALCLILRFVYCFFIHSDAEIFDLKANSKIEYISLDSHWFDIKVTGGMSSNATVKIFEYEYRSGKWNQVKEFFLGGESISEEWHYEVYGSLMKVVYESGPNNNGRIRIKIGQ